MLHLTLLSLLIPHHAMPQNHTNTLMTFEYGALGSKCNSCWPILCAFVSIVIRTSKIVAQ